MRAQDKYEKLKEQARSKVIKTHRRTLTEVESGNSHKDPYFTFMSSKTKKSGGYGLDSFNINSKD